jgi:hypothetical protein
VVHNEGCLDYREIQPTYGGLMTQLSALLSQIDSVKSFEVVYHD